MCVLQHIDWWNHSKGMTTYIFIKPKTEDLIWPTVTSSLGLIKNSLPPVPWHIQCWVGIASLQFSTRNCKKISYWTPEIVSLWIDHTDAAVDLLGSSAVKHFPLWRLIRLYPFHHLHKNLFLKSTTTCQFLLHTVQTMKATCEDLKQKHIFYMTARH